MFILILLFGLATDLFIIQHSSADATDTHPVLAQEGYIFENDDNSSADGLSQLAGSEFASSKTLDAVRQGERINLRTQITNTGTAVSGSDELGLFYDKGDGIWNKVKFQDPLADTPGAAEDCQGFIDSGGSGDWYCDLVTDGDNANDATTRVDMAINPLTNQPWIVSSSHEAAATAGGNLVLSRFVGSGGNCDGFDDSGGSDAWNCETVFNGTNADDVSTSAIAFDNQGKPWIAFRDLPGSHDRLIVAEYVGSGGNCDTFDDSGGSDAWQCTTVLDGRHVGDDTAYFELAVSPSGTPWVMIADNNSNDRDLFVAEYVGGGSGNCQSFTGSLDGAENSADWQCTIVVDGNESNDAVEASISFDADGNPWISYQNVESGGADLTVVEYVGGGGGNCLGYDDVGGSNDWQCTTVVQGDDSNDFINNTIKFNPDNNPVVVTRNVESASVAGGNLLLVEYVGSGGNCQGFDGAGGSNAWRCTTIVDGDDADDVLTSDFAFDASGNPLIAFRNDELGFEINLAHYVGSGGNCDGFDDSGGSDAWQCTVLVDGGNADNPSISVDANGDIWTAFRKEGSSQGDLAIARLDRGGEIQLAPSTGLSRGDVLSESHADMTSAGDTANRDDADCLNGSAAWNNGVYFGADTGTGLTLADGNTTPQCTEIIWTLDTSQALPGETYRFVVSSKDAFTADNGPWRGPSSIAAEAYPELTIKETQHGAYRYSKDVLGIFSDCADADWGCLSVDTADNVGEDNDIAFDHSGNAWISYEDDTNGDLKVANYVGSGGTGCAVASWNCATIDSAGLSGNYTNIAVDNSGIPWVSFRHIGSSELRIARYVGSGGSGCASSAWTCSVVDDTGVAGSGVFSSLAFDGGGNPWIAYRVGSTTDNDLRVAQFVGSGGSGCGTPTAWDCTDIDTTNNVGADPSLAFNSEGNPWIAYRDTTNSNLRVAQMVGSGGSGCASAAWNCVVVAASTDHTTARSTSIAFNPSGEAWISYRLETTDDLRVARYVGGGSGTGCTSSDWTCSDVDTSGDVGLWTSLAFGPGGEAWIAYDDLSNFNLKVARYVASGGSGCADSAWQCESVDTGGDVGSQNTIAFDHSGLPWVSYRDNSGTGLKAARLHMPPESLGSGTLTPFGGRNAGSGDLRYRLSPGLSPATDQYGVCGGNSGLSGYCGLYHPEGHTDSMSVNAGERPVYGFSTRYETNSSLPTANIYFNTDMSPDTENVVLQAYRFGTTNAWETVATYSNAGCASDNCLLRGLPSGTVGEYFEADGSDYWVHFRVYQTEAASAYTFSIDSFNADINPRHLRGGRIFREEISDPFGW